MRFVDEVLQTFHDGFLREANGLGDAFLARPDHDGRAVRVVGAEVVAAMPAELLEIIILYRGIDIISSKALEDRGAAMERV